MTRNGKEKIDLDLIVLDSQDHECDFYAHGNKQCSCQHSYTGSVQRTHRDRGLGCNL